MCIGDQLWYLWEGAINLHIHRGHRQSANRASAMPKKGRARQILVSVNTTWKVWAGLQSLFVIPILGWCSGQRMNDSRSWKLIADSDVHFASFRNPPLNNAHDRALQKPPGCGPSPQPCCSSFQADASWELARLSRPTLIINHSTLE